MYEQGLRLGREAPGLKSLQKQVWTILLFFMLGEFVLGERGGGGGMHCVTSCNYLTLLKVESVDMMFSCLLLVCCLFVVCLFVCCLFVCLLFVCLFVCRLTAIAWH